METMRVERDSLGEVSLPSWAYWGAQTERARDTFRISGLVWPAELIAALGLIKQHAAVVHRDLGLLEPRLAEPIIQAAGEVAIGQWNAHFPLDIFQTGSGTSTNMNANEVIANRASEILGSPLGSRHPVHPNDHVNLGQSSNDVIPTAIHVAVRLRAGSLRGALAELQAALDGKAGELAGVIKPGRTHLQDAVPITLGMEFSGYAAQIEHGIARLDAACPDLEQVALGGTAIGTGLNAHPGAADRMIAALATATGLALRPASNRFAAMGAQDALVAFMGVLNTIAVSVMKIANDLRLLSSGPRAGLGEISVPILQPGSSIMPGKVNPVVLEALIQVAAQVMGAQQAVSIGGQHGPLELNMMMPMMAYNALFAARILEHGAAVLAGKCIAGITANVEQCARGVEWSLANATPLAPRIGYDRAAQVAQRAWREGRTVRAIALAEGLLTEAEADEILDPRKMLGSPAPPGTPRRADA